MSRPRTTTRPPRRPAPGVPHGGGRRTPGVPRGAVPIDHARIIDGHGDRIGVTHYQPREVPCGRCGARFVFTARDQKYVHEVRGVPVKMADRGAAYCPACVRVRAAENRARRARAHAQRLHEEARRIAAERPDDPSALLGVVAARFRLIDPEPSAHAANELVGLARRALRLDPARVEARYWEGRALLAAGHVDAARRALEAFLDVARDVPRHAETIEDARARLAALLEPSG